VSSNRRVELQKASPESPLRFYAKKDSLSQIWHAKLT
jgi:hypothetical protein